MRTGSAPTVHQGRTLVEVLTVVAIVVLLLSLVLGGVQKVRALAARSRDQNNLRQIGIAVHGYASANGGVLPPSQMHETQQPTRTGVRYIRWFGKLDGPTDRGHRSRSTRPAARSPRT